MKCVEQEAKQVVSFPRGLLRAPPTGSWQTQVVGRVPAQRRGRVGRAGFVEMWLLSNQHSGRRLPDFSIFKVVVVGVQSLSHVWLLQHTRLPCPSLSPGVCSDSCPLSQWCHPTISSSAAFFCLQSFPASGSFPMSQLFASGSQSIRASASTSFLPMNIQGWYLLGLTGLISLMSKGLSRVFSNTTVQK